MFVQQVAAPDNNMVELTGWVITDHYVDEITAERIYDVYASTGEIDLS